MKISDIIGILLFIIPGTLCSKVFAWLSMPSRTKKTEFQEIVNKVFWSFPIIFVSGLIYQLQYRFYCLSDFTIMLNNIQLLLKFSTIVLCVSIGFGIIGGIMSDKLLSGINWIRKKILKRVPLNTNTTCWDDLFGFKFGSQFLEIIKDGNSSKGFVDHFSLPDEDKEVILNIPEYWNDYPELEGKITKVKNTYINVEKGIVVKDYDLKEYLEYIDQLWKQHNN